MRALRYVTLPTVFLACASVQQTATFRVEEAGVADIHAALRTGATTCRSIVAQYMARIDAYDQHGPSLNAIVAVNRDAARIADSLDVVARSGARMGALHCIPVIVKDNFETKDLPTTAGSLSLAGFVSHRDAFMVRRIREAGAVVIAKSNMAEFAFSPYETLSSTLGHTRNPYVPDRVTAGSSGGTAAGVAASFGAVGLGTDTGNSIRGPSSFQALVGIRSTMGLTSRSGVVPLNLASDIAGPMARTVADAVAVFQVVAGHDPDDPATEISRGRPIPDYSASLIRDGLRGARIGVLRQAYERRTTDSGVVEVFERALADMRAGGATVVDTVLIPRLDSLQRISRGGCNPFRHDLESWIASTGNRTPVKSLAEIVDSGKFHPSVRARLQAGLAVQQSPSELPGCQARDEFRAALRTAVLQAMDELRLDALVYPTWSNPPRVIGDLQSPHGDNSQLFAPSTGWPAIQVPMGYTNDDTLPAGITFFGRAFSEPVLIRLAYSYEQATRHRRMPPTTPPLR
jgi:amidase